MSHSHVASRYVLPLAGFGAALALAGTRWSAVLAAAALVVLVASPPGRSPALRTPAAGLAAGTVAAAVAGLVRAALDGARGLPEWDFLVFWLNGRAAATGADFYSPEVYRALVAGQDWHVSEDFTRAILDVGAWYPPTGMLVFVPLGWFGPGPAAWAWHALLLAGAAGAAWAVARAFPAGDRRTTLALALLVLAALPATVQTLRFAQTNLLLVLLVALAWSDRGRARGGLWLGLAVVLKPIALLLLAWPLVARRWRMLSGTALTLSAAVAASAAAFGPAVFARYLASPPSGRMPAFVYTETINQSLLAVVLRATGWTGGHPPFETPLFLVAAALLALATAALLVRCGRRREDLALALLVPAALLLYPATLAHYAVLLAIPLAVACGRADLARVPRQAAACACALVVAASALPHGTFWAAALSWCLFALAALVPFPVPRAGLGPAAAGSRGPA